MSFVIMHSESGMYLYSDSVKVCEKLFARRFSSAKQAKAFLRTTTYHADECVICELTAEETERRESEFSDLINS